MSNVHVFAMLGALSLGACSSSGPAVATPTVTATAPSDVPLRASVARLASAWNAGSGDAWAAEYWSDGSLVNILGIVFPSAQAVAGVTNTILAGPFKGSTFVANVRDVRFIGTTGAIVDVDVDVTNFHALPPGAVATAPNLLTTRFIFVFENRGGVWKIEASQNTAVAPSPPPA